MILWQTIALMVGLAMQTGSAPALSDDGLTAAEREQLQQQQNIENRIKIYDNATARFFKTIEASVLKDDFDSVPALLKSWTKLLDMALKDIDANASRKKKSKALIRYEIRVRKAISNMQDYKIRAPVDQQEAFDAWLNNAEETRKKFVAILFPG